MKQLRQNLNCGAKVRRKSVRNKLNKRVDKLLLYLHHKYQEKYKKIII